MADSPPMRAARLPYEMFDVSESAAEARRLDRMENMYHRGQALSWSGPAVLSELVKTHGPVQLPPELREPLKRVLGSIMWSELGAWKVSAQLADRLEPMGAKMAATSQAHDEARHFQAIHDYAVMATGLPERLYPATERLLLDVLETDDLACKLMGMQLQAETAALTLFQLVREKRICPVLSDLLLYFEKDEARHVGLGMQYLPLLLETMTPLRRARFRAFALKIAVRLVATNRALEPDLRALGLDPRAAVRLGRSKQALVFGELWSAAPFARTKWGDAARLVIQSVAGALWPEDDNASALARVSAFVRAMRRDGLESVATTIDPIAEPTQTETPPSFRASLQPQEPLSQ